MVAKSAIRCTGASGELPFFFSSAGRPLYGAFHPANAALGKKCVLVFCHAIGTEHMLTQRIEALGAQVAAKIGFAAFRYNARAHGDSAGNPQEVTFADLIEDACASADMARELSGASRIIWVGLRLGCIVAAEAACRRNDTGAVALWEPLHSGADYFRSLMRATLFTQIAKGRRPSVNADNMLDQLERDGEVPVVGGYVYRALYDSAKHTDLGRSLQNWDGETLIAQVQRRRNLSPDNERLRAAIEQRQNNAKVTIALISEEPPWTMMPIVKPQWTSDGLLNATREWLNGLE
jgi:pimeloyl-ACP methyl ester carboxylesterase